MINIEKTKNEFIAKLLDHFPKCTGYTCQHYNDDLSISIALKFDKSLQIVVHNIDGLNPDAEKAASTIKAAICDQ